jgi:serine/threonine-protein kinase
VQRFGEYELLERVAVGGMAEVYKARVHRPGGVGKTLCIKRVHPKYCADPSFRQMFIEEARIGVSLSHGNIVPVFDFGSIDGLYYLAMEFVEGRDLAQITGRARLVGVPMPKTVAVYVASEVLEGLHYAHERSEEDGRPLHIVHRDVSPSNLLVSNAGEVKILDFGIARAEIREFETRTGVVKGTPGYMSPEQKDGGRPDRRADVFSVAVILWELLKNERYPSDLLGPPPPSGDAALDAVIGKAMSTDPEARYATAHDMREALLEILVTRGQRPGAADLAAYVDDVLDAEAEEEDWRWRKSAPGESGIGSEPPQEDREPSKPATRSIRPSAPAAPRTEQITQPARRTRRIVLAGVALLALGGVATAAVLVPDGEGDTARTAAPLAAEKGTLIVRTDPAGAEVAIDGDRVGQSPWTGSDLEPGDHVLWVRKDGHREVEKTIAIRAGGSRTEDVVLVPLTGRLRIETDPAGARVVVDDRDVGRSPIETPELAPGPHRIRVEVGSRPPVERRGEVVADVTRTIEIAIPAVTTPPVAMGRLDVNTTSAWGEVFVDGARVADHTPAIGIALRAGRHVVEVKNPTRGVRQRTVIVRGGETEQVTFDWAAD